MSAHSTGSKRPDSKLESKLPHSQRPDSKHLIEIVEGFSQQSILVLADFVADEFIFGEISRVSREAPVLILRRREMLTLPGGGANAVNNLVALGARVFPIATLGDDAAGVGYLLKDRVSDLERFADAIRRVAEGGSALDPEVVSEMLGRKRTDDPLNVLTAREREVLGLMAEGRSNQAIAEILVITERAVERHVTSIFAKLNLAPAAEDHRRVRAVLVFLGT